MKVIDLLNKIANGEEVPKIIQWGELLFEWEEYGFHDYKSFGTGEHLLVQGFATCCLNDEVEVIEEDKKIEKIEPANYCIDTLREKINEIIDLLNKE